MSTARSLYRIVRSILFSAIGLVAALYLFLYVGLSIPYVQNRISRLVSEQLSTLTGGKVSIGEVNIFPFNEAVVKDLRVLDPSGKQCLYVGKVGAGIDLTRLVFQGRIVITYAELMEMDASLSQAAPDSPLNIQFLIDAFSSKDKKKEPTRFDLELHSVVIRNCSASFDKEWLPRRDDGRVDFNHLYVRNLKADVDIPRLSNDDYQVDLRRLSLEGPRGLSVNTLSLKARVTPSSIEISDLILKLPGTDIRPSDLSLSFSSFSDIRSALENDVLHFTLDNSTVTPSDFSCFLPALADMRYPLLISLDASGNLRRGDIRRLSLRTSGSENLSLNLSGSFSGLDSLRGKGEADVSSLTLSADSRWAAGVVQSFVALPEKVSDLVSKSGHVGLDLQGHYSVSGRRAETSASLSTALGSLDVSGVVEGLGSPLLSLSGDVEGSGLDMGTLLTDERLGNVSFTASASGKVGKGIAEGTASIDISEAQYGNVSLSDISANVRKIGSEIAVSFTSDNEVARCGVDARASLAGALSHWQGEVSIGRLAPSLLGVLPAFRGLELSGDLAADLTGNSIDNLSGFVSGHDIRIKGNDERGDLSLSSFLLDVSGKDSPESPRLIDFSSDFLDFSLEGNYSLASLPGEMQMLLSSVIPSFVKMPGKSVDLTSQGEFKVSFRPCDRLLGFLNAPVRILVPFSLVGDFDMPRMVVSADMSVPYLQQGRDKLVRDTRLSISLAGESGRGGVSLHTLYPSKKGDAELDVLLTACRGDLTADLGWKIEQMKGFAGMLSLAASTTRDPLHGRDSFVIGIRPTSFSLSGAEWQIGESRIRYADKCLEIDDFKVWHDRQFISIGGRASASPEDIVEVSLADIDLGFIFDTLNINYVTFGGIATGELSASGVFSGSPVASTRFLHVKDLSYNESVLGDGDIVSRWNNEEKEVEIGADISEEGRRVARLDGGIWVGADSLNFKIDADKVDIGFLKPFMATFTSDVGGRASGWANLYGNFHDIDLKGRLFADSIGIKIDYTNVYYHGTDSVRIDPGHIDIPGFRIHDRYGNSAVLSGTLSHRYFHDPSFEFKISDARKLLCYDTNASINPVWYGRIFGNGGGILRGWPGGVTIDVDMATAPGSDFTFVISDEQEVGEYDFLSFSDRRKEASRPAPVDSVPDFVKAFRKNVESRLDIPSLFSMNLFATVTPDALLTIVMDPQSGDRITARGSGPMQVKYDSETDNFAMYGRYSLAEGKYNFILQDLILRDFTIRPGSSIAFDGDPLRANLDILAAYRVNTSLADLDESFAHDPELNRTNVPVDAMLAITGEMEQPEISFDIELPTLTSDVARKVKSIVSTDDMMNRQVLYLLALNRFYTPEYMSNHGNGGELASVASSTLSSQFSRIVGQMTDKVTLAPSFRSDKGDFSDFEMDLALSSRLLDNRLLLNGNFGYRDRTTSSTTFIGDFDIEYLLNRSGNLRLKAFNHFNDQNYYLKSSLTTQGIGVAYRRDFDSLFSFLRRRRRESTPVPETPADSVPSDSVDNTLIEIQ